MDDKSELAMYKRMENTLVGEWRYYLHMLEQTQRSLDEYRRLIYDLEK